MAQSAKCRPLATDGTPKCDQLGQIDNHNSQRNARRQHLAGRLHACGPRPVLEAMLELEAGADLDHLLERYTRIPAGIYRAFGADVLAIDTMAVLDGGRS